jgi:hypothetical protein
MAISLMQKIRLWWRGAQRRRDDQQRQFVAANVGWGPPAAATTPAPRATIAASAEGIDRAGLQAAYLDGSGVIGYYLDVVTGEVVESRQNDLAAPRYLRVPTQSEEEDRSAFLVTLDGSARDRLGAARSFRAALAEDRALERAWYNFKNDRATAAIEQWLREIGK